MAWEMTHLPVIVLTGDRWDPTKDVLQPGVQIREHAELRTIRSLTSGMTKLQIASIRKEQAESCAVKYGKVEHELLRSHLPLIREPFVID